MININSPSWNNFFQYSCQLWVIRNALCKNYRENFHRCRNSSGDEFNTVPIYMHTSSRSVPERTSERLTHLVAKLESAIRVTLDIYSVHPTFRTDNERLSLEIVYLLYGRTYCFSCESARNRKLPRVTSLRGNFQVSF